jgi:hypothetical protein
MQQWLDAGLHICLRSVFAIFEYWVGEACGRTGLESKFQLLAEGMTARHA